MTLFHYLSPELLSQALHLTLFSLQERHVHIPVFLSRSVRIRSKIQGTAYLPVPAAVLLFSEPLYGFLPQMQSSFLPDLTMFSLHII